jgi:cell shape-determining protein MreC
VRKGKAKTFTFGALVIILLLLIFFEPSYGWKIREFLSAPGPAPADQTLIEQNQVLKAQVAQLQVVAAQLPIEPPENIRAMVYSRYPLNFKNEMLINVGANENITTGTAITFQGIFIGETEEIFSGSSLVRTVFDDGLKLPVRIGNSGYDGLLEGGADPSVVSIAKSSNLAVGDIVYAAAPGIPYGLPVGEIAATSTSPDNLFQTASLSFSYDLNQIETVFVAP